MPHSGRFADLAPAEVRATLLDEGGYPGPVSTCCRVLREAGSGAPADIDALNQKITHLEQHAADLRL